MSWPGTSTASQTPGGGWRPGSGGVPEPPSTAPPSPPPPPWSEALAAQNAATEPPPPPGSAPTEPLAIVALVVAVATLLTCPIIGAVAALIVARRARLAVEASNGRKGGRPYIVAAKAVAWTNVTLCALIAVAIAGVALFTPPGRRVDFARLKPGDCFNRATVGATVVTVRVVPCTNTHQHEVFGVVQYPAAQGAPFPGRDDIQLVATSLCAGPFQTYLTNAQLPEGLRFGFVYPEQKRWSKGDRTIICEVFEATGKARSSSIRAGP